MCLCKYKNSSVLFNFKFFRIVWKMPTSEVNYDVCMWKISIACKWENLLFVVVAVAVATTVVAAINVAVAVAGYWVVEIATVTTIISIKGKLNNIQMKIHTHKHTQIQWISNRLTKKLVRMNVLRYVWPIVKM